MDLDQINIVRLKSGDTLAFECLYNKWSGKLYNFIMRISHGDEYLAEEIVQSVFIKIWENKDKIDSERSFSSYLYTIAKNQLFNIYEHRMVEFIYKEREGNEQNRKLYENSTEKDTDFHFLDDYIDKLIELLPSMRRNIYILSKRHLLSNKEIAKRLHLSENTIESQLSKANRFIKEQLQKHYDLTIFLLYLYLFAGKY